MHEIPDSPAQFAEEYLPARISEFGDILKAQTASGSAVFRVLGCGEWSYWLENGELQHQAGVAGDVLAQLTISEADFEPLILRGVRRAQQRGTPSLDMTASALVLDEERADLVRNLAGNTLALALTDDGREHRIYLTPGPGAPDLESPHCVVHTDIKSLIELEEQRGDPMDMFFDKRFRIIGNANLALALGGLFA